MAQEELQENEKPSLPEEKAQNSSDASHNSQMTKLITIPARLPCIRPIKKAKKKKKPKNTQQFPWFVVFSFL